MKLAIAVESATDLPARDYGAHCDPWVSVTVIRFEILVNVILVVCLRIVIRFSVNTILVTAL